ncbi:MAG: hypothetical protein SGJ24_08030 [Chloroflexota bacterium]|nr:hypothetical protein [Chloroflexota bacterium]
MGFYTLQGIETEVVKQDMDITKTLRSKKNGSFNRPSALTGIAKLIDPFDKVNKPLSTLEQQAMQSANIQASWQAVGDYLRFGIVELSHEVKGRVSDDKSRRSKPSG